MDKPAQRVYEIVAPRLVPCHLDHIGELWEASPSAILLWRYCVLREFRLLCLRLLLLPPDDYIVPLLDELPKSDSYQHRINNPVEIAVVTELEAVEEKQELRHLEVVVIVRNRLGKEVRLTVGERTFAVAVKHEVQYLRKKPHRRRVGAVCGFQRGKCWSLTEERPILVARGVNLRVGVHRHEELVTATVLFQHERRLPLQVWR